MRIALVCPYDLGRFGGVQDQVLQLARRLRAAGDEVRVVGPGSDGPAGAVLVGRSRVLRANRSDVPISLQPAAVGAVAEAIAGVDVVHVHEPLMPLVSLAAMLRARVPVVATFHAAPSALMRRGYRIGRGLVARTLERASVVTAVSPAASQPIEAAADVRLIPNGVDLTVRPQVPRIPHRVAFVGRPEPRKGLHVLLAAWPEVRRHVPDAELVVMGADAPAETPPGVVFAGRVPEEEKWRLLASSGVSCAPNLGGESFGIVVAEGMAAGCAVVASALPGFVHVAGEAALLTKPGDAASLAWSLRSVLSDEALAGDLRAQAAARVEMFGWPHVLAGYRRAYEDACSA